MVDDRAIRSRSRTDDAKCNQTRRLARAGAAGAESLNFSLGKKHPDGKMHTTDQTWVKGKPWWTEAKYYHDGEVWC